MKKKEIYPKYVQAMLLMDEGKTANYVMHHLKMGLGTITRIRPIYLQGGELALLNSLNQGPITTERKVEIVEEIEKKGLSLHRATREYGIPERTLERWLKAYREKGAAGLARKQKQMKKRHRTEAEMDELEMLRRRNEYLEAENALLKKVKALVEEREARLRATGQKPSKD